MTYKCCHCGVNLAHVKHSLVIRGVLMPYCRAPECQESMKQTAKAFDDNGIFARMVEL
jgi:hypothetical protein